MNPVLTISVVLYHNPPEEVNLFLENIAKSNVETHVYLIDNSANELLSIFNRTSGVTYIKMAKNVGYGEGHNVAILHPQNQAPFHLIANADVQFEPGVLSGMLQFLKDNPMVSAINPKVRYPNGRLQHLRKFLPRPQDLFLRRFVPNFIKPFFKKQLNHFEMRHFSPDKIQWVPALSGCFIMCRSSALHAVHGFDNRFFLYLEDYDLSRRLNQHGKTLYLPRYTVVHHHGKASYGFGKALFYHLRSVGLYFSKHGWFEDAERDALNAEAMKFNCQ